MKKIILISLPLLFGAVSLRAQVIPVDGASAGGNYAINPYPGNFTTYYDGFSVVFRSNHQGPGPCTMIIGGVGPSKSIVTTSGAALVAGDIKANQVVTIVYDFAAGNFQMISASGNSGGGAGWSTIGNSGTADGVNFIGTTDGIPFNVRVANNKAGRIESSGGTGNTFWGYQSGNANTGIYNTASGYQALFSNTTGNWNTAMGMQALFSNTGAGNTALGWQSLRDNNGGNNNTATGWQTLLLNVTGSNNTASGAGALYSNSGGSNATAIGTNAMQYANDQVGTFVNANVALGYEALRGSATPASNTGNQNTALGYQPLWSNTTGNYNTATGYQALYSNNSGYGNTATGYQALWSNQGAFNNTAFGKGALFATVSAGNNVAVGINALWANTTGANNTGLGAYALNNNASASANTAVGSYAMQANTYAEQNVALGKDALYTQNFSNTGIPYSGNNVAIGFQALYSNNPTGTANGVQNTAMGSNALRANTTGFQNTAIGYQAGYTTIPANANTSGSNNTFIGANAGPGSPTQRTKAVAIGYNAKVDADNALVLGGTGADAVNVGIGTPFPANKLDVIGPGNIAAQVTSTNAISSVNIMTQSATGGHYAGVAFSNDAFVPASRLQLYTSTSGGQANEFSLYHFPNAPMTFYTNNAERMRIDGGGKVGIGTNNPGARLEVYDASNSAPLFLRSSIGATGDMTRLVFLSLAGAAQLNAQIAGVSDNFGTMSSGLSFLTTSAGSTTEKMRILGNGNVGIGTTAPEAKLHVLGKIRLGSETGTSEAPSVPSGYSGLVLRRINSADSAMNQVVAVLGPGVKLERNGTRGGMIVRFTAAPTTRVIVQAFNSSGAPTNSGFFVSGTGTNTFGGTTTFKYIISCISNEEYSEVSMMRLTATDGLWVGNITSTIDQ